MSTDAQILTAARDYHAACQAVKAADAAKADIERKVQAATNVCNEARKRATESRTRLEQLAAAKPAEPPPKPPEPIWATEPPKNMADSMASLSDADAPEPKQEPPKPAPIVPLKAPVPTLNSKRK